MYGDHVAKVIEFRFGLEVDLKVSLDVLEARKHVKNGHYVVVTGINPTPLGD